VATSDDQHTLPHIVASSMVRQGVRPDGDGDDRHDGGRSGSSESFTETIRWAVGMLSVGSRSHPSPDAPPPILAGGSQTVAGDLCGWTV
jgi:hypothetical protein